MLLQFLLIFFFGFCTYDLSKKYKSFYFIFPFVLLLFVLAISLRNPLEHDTKAYISFFSKIGDGNLYLPKERFEIGFQILTALLKLISFGYVQIYFFYVTLINIIFLHKAAENFLSSFHNFDKSDCMLCEILFLCYFGIFYNAIAMRGSIALSLCLYANSFFILKKRKLFPLLLITLAAFIHNSAIVFGFFSFFLFLIKPLQKRFLYFLWAITGIVYFGNLFASVVIGFIQSPVFLSSLNSISPTLSKLFAFYVKTTYTTDYGIAKRYVLYYFLEFVFIKNYDRGQDTHGKMLFVYVVGMFLMTAGRMIAQIERVSDYFIMYQPFLILSCLKKEKTILGSHYLFYAVLVGLLFCQTMFSVNLFNMGLLSQFQ